jgi:glycosyltransferase involved in cell wall biosynthesis
MNLLLADQFSDPGGAQQALLELLPSIRERGWRAVVALPGRGELFGAVHDLGFDTERIDCGPYGSSRKTAGDVGRFFTETPRLAAQIRSLARKHQTELLYINGPRLLPAAALAAVRCPILFHSHSYVGQGMARRLAGLALRKTRAHIVGNCEFVAAQWRPYVAASRIAIIYNGVSGPSREPVHPRAAHPLIGCIGRIAPEKGQREFVAAAAAIHRAIPECRFVVYGETLFADAVVERYAAEVRAAAASLPMEFAGWTPDVYGAMSRLDLLLVPSVGPEATTRVIPEAFAAGLPVIAFGTGGIPEVIEHGMTGLVVRNADEMVSQAIALLNGPRDRLDAMAHAARADWEARFTLEKFHEQLLGVMEEAGK